MTHSNVSPLPIEALCYVEGKPVFIADILYCEKHTPQFGDCRVLLKETEQDGVVKILAQEGVWITIPTSDLSWEKPQNMKDREEFDDFISDENNLKLLRKIRPCDREFAIWQLGRVENTTSQSGIQLLSETENTDTI